MAKLLKNYYYNSKGERKVNCYVAHIPRKLIEQTTINPDKNIAIKVEKDKIIIEKQ